MRTVIRRLSVDQFLDNGAAANTAVYWDLVRAVNDAGVSRVPSTEQEINLGPVTLRVLPITGLPEQNNNSVGILLEYGDFLALFTGDSEAEALNFWLDRGMPDVTLLKAAHHGSRNGVTPRWVDVTRPEVVIISVGSTNAFGHPDPWALRYYAAVSAQILRTDIHGDVTIIGHGDGSYDVQTSQGPMTHTAGPAITPLVSQSSPDPIEMIVVANPPGNDNYNLNGEYVIIRNNASEPVAIGSWTLCDAARHCFRFPDGSRLIDSVLVHTGTGPTGSRMFYAGFGRAVWNNNGDVATLVDQNGRVTARTEY